MRRDVGRIRGGDGVGVAVQRSGTLAGKRARVRVRIEPLPAAAVVAAGDVVIIVFNNGRRTVRLLALNSNTLVDGT